MQAEWRHLSPDTSYERFLSHMLFSTVRWRLLKFTLSHSQSLDTSHRCTFSPHIDCRHSHGVTLLRLFLQASHLHLYWASKHSVALIGENATWRQHTANVMTAGADWCSFKLSVRALCNSWLCQRKRHECEFSIVSTTSTDSQEYELYFQSDLNRSAMCVWDQRGISASLREWLTGLDWISLA